MARTVGPAETYQGKPCLHGHSGVRYRNSNGKCVDCVKAESHARSAGTDYNKRYYERTREDQLAFHRGRRGALHRYRSKSKQRGLPWNLTDEEALVLLNGSCHWCGRLGGGIDRVDNSRGYETDNTVPCCIVCNRAKADQKVEDFLSWVRAVCSRYPVD